MDAAMLATCSWLFVRGLLAPRNQPFDRPVFDLDIDLDRSGGGARFAISAITTGRGLGRIRSNYSRERVPFGFRVKNIKNET